MKTIEELNDDFEEISFKIYHENKANTESFVNLASAFSVLREQVKDRKIMRISNGDKEIYLENYDLTEEKLDQLVSFITY